MADISVHRLCVVVVWNAAVSTAHSLWVTADFVLRDKMCLYVGGKTSDSLVIWLSSTK